MDGKGGAAEGIYQVFWGLFLRVPLQVIDFQ